MSNMSLIKRGCAALATIFCLTGCASVGLAQTYYNYQGGSGTWNVSGGTVWANGAAGAAGAAGLGANTPQNQPWVNDGTAAATFGYLTTSGSGTTNKYQIYDFTSSYFTPVTLDPNNVINANSLLFGNVPNGTSQYGLTGGSLNLTANGTGTSPNVEIDMATNPPSIANTNIEISIASNLTVGGGAGTLSFCTAENNVTSNISDNSLGNLFLSGSNQFASAIVGGIGQNLPDLRNYTALVFMNTQSMNYKGQVPNITLGNQAEVVYMGPNLSSGTLGTITLQPGIGVNSSPGGTALPTVDQASRFSTYTPNTGQQAFAFGGVGCIGRIGAGSTNSAAANNSYPTLYVGAITGPGDVEFATSYASDGGGVVVLTATSSYTGDTFLAQG